MNNQANEFGANAIGKDNIASGNNSGAFGINNDAIGAQGSVNRR